MIDRLAEAIVPRPGLSMRCAGCDGKMVLRRNAIGAEYLRCPTCNPLAPDPRRHPDDAMLPQGLVKTGESVRIIEKVVRVVEPAPEPIVLTALPELRPGQVRCQLCAEGVDPSCKFCPKCAPRGQRIVDEAKARNAGIRTPGQRFAQRKCETCGTTFQPTGPASKFCSEHRR